MTPAGRARILLATALLAMTSVVAAIERPESADPAQNYLLFCGGCHGVAGTGVPHRVPALNATVARLLSVEGGRELLLRFPGVANSQLSDQGLAQVMNLCVARFGGPDRPAALRPYTADEVHAARQSPQLNIRRSRAEFMRRAGLPPEEAADY